MLRERQDTRIERTLGTEIYIAICADYLDIFMNPCLTLRERVVLCGKVSFFLDFGDYGASMEIIPLEVTLCQLLLQPVAFLCKRSLTFRCQSILLSF